MSGKTFEQLRREFEARQPYCHRCDNFKVACVCDRPLVVVETDNTDGKTVDTIR